MKLISETLNDIECKLEIYYAERTRLIKEKNREQKVDPYKLSAIDYSKAVIDSYKKYDIKIRDDDYIKKINEKLEKLEREIVTLEDTKEKYINTLYKLDGIEYRLYTNILKGYNPTNAIEKVGEENYLRGTKPTTRNGLLPYYYKIKEFC